MNSALPSEAPSPETGLRERQNRAARVRVVQAFLDLAHEDGAVNVSIPAVAKACGISTRTIYRYFATKADLQNAAAYHMSEQALHGGDIGTTDATNLLDMLKAMWSSFGEQLPAVMAEHSTPAGRSIRATRLDGARETTRRALPDGADDEAVDLVVAVTSSSMFLELVERMNYAPEVAAAMATRLAQLVLVDEQRKAQNSNAQTSNSIDPTSERPEGE